MHLRDTSGWHQLTYGLIYPAVLGSMLYDVLHLSTLMRDPEVFIGKLCIIIFYCLDYLHLHIDYDSDNERNRNPCAIASDMGIALLLGIAYWDLSQNSSRLLLWILLLVFS